MRKAQDAAFRFGVRRSLVMDALGNGIKPTVRAYKTTVRTVRKWVKRYREKGVDGLHEVSRAPKKNQISFERWSPEGSSTSKYPRQPTMLTWRRSTT
ncbi:MAG: helix-turn-helix domain-containing protein [Elusimicrobia bacterium]|nr:helix-turn-helix domain-containing protein [Elusimicrobiota bacterium]